ncbi:hypothetical protein MHK_007743, partial [Candidatus Magnetomorum sp. HK-1]
VNDRPISKAIADQQINEGDIFHVIRLDDHIIDIDNDLKDITWSVSGNNHLLISLDNRLAIIKPPDNHWNGVEIISFTARDPEGLSVSISSAFTVTPVNDPPKVSEIRIQPVEEGDTFDLIQLDKHVEDIDNEKSEIVWTVSGNNALEVSIKGRSAQVIIP